MDGRTDRREDRRLRWEWEEVTQKKMGRIGTQAGKIRRQRTPTSCVSLSELSEFEHLGVESAGIEDGGWLRVRGVRTARVC